MHLSKSGSDLRWAQRAIRDQALQHSHYAFFRFFQISNVSSHRCWAHQLLSCSSTMTHCFNQVNDSFSVLYENLGLLYLASQSQQCLIAMASPRQWKWNREFALFGSHLLSAVIKIAFHIRLSHWKSRDEAHSCFRRSPLHPPLQVPLPHLPSTGDDITTITLESPPFWSSLWSHWSIWLVLLPLRLSL